MSESIYSATLAVRRASIGRSRIRVAVVTAGYIAMVIGVVIAMFSGTFTGMLTVAAAWFAVLYAMTTWWLSRDRRRIDQRT